MQLDELRHDVALARRVQPEIRRVPVLLQVLTEVIEAAVASSRSKRRLRIDLVEIRQHRLGRGPKAVEIEPIEAGTRRRRHPVVVRPEPADKIEDVGVAPHPGREATEITERLLGILVDTRASHVPVDAVGVGPVGLDGHGGEALLLDEAPRDERPFAIKLVRPVRRLTEQHDTRVADPMDERVVLRRIA